MFGGFGRPQPSSAEKIAAAEAEMDLVTDMFNKYDLHTSFAPKPQAPIPFNLLILCFCRLQQACMKKCIPKEYREGELNKGEGVCIDRCAAKFFDVQMKISELLQQEAQAKGAGGGMGFGGM
jgi:import inner membrane translocase subunit TIM10